LNSEIELRRESWNQPELKCIHLNIPRLRGLKEKGIERLAILPHDVDDQEEKKIGKGKNEKGSREEEENRVLQMGEKENHRELLDKAQGDRGSVKESTQSKRPREKKRNAYKSKVVKIDHRRESSIRLRTECSEKPDDKCNQSGEKRCPPIHEAGNRREQDARKSHKSHETIESLSVEKPSTKSDRLPKGGAGKGDVQNGKF